MLFANYQLQRKFTIQQGKYQIKNKFLYHICQSFDL